MMPFHSIESFRNFTKNLQNHCNYKEVSYPVLDFIGTVKIHGTNAGVHIDQNGKIIPQSRSRELSIESDNYNFAAFVGKNKEAFRNLWETYWKDKEITIYGEWAGEGIQNNVGVNLLKRHFIIFDIYDHDTNHYFNDLKYSNKESDIYNILMAPTFHITIDFSKPEESNETLLNFVLEVERECPWAKLFGISGIGEGIVWRCEQNPDLVFKTKGEKHANKSAKTKNFEVNLENVSALEEMADLLLPAWRLEQGIEALKSENKLEKKFVGEYIKWQITDILKEERNQIEESGVEFKQLNKYLVTKIKQYFFKEVEKGF